MALRRNHSLVLVLVLTAAVVLSTVVAPGVAVTLGPAPSAGLDPAPGPGVAALPALQPEVPSARAFTLFVSGTTAGAAPLLGPAPLADATARHGKTIQHSTGGELFARSLDGTSVLAHVKVAEDIAVAHTVYAPDRAAGNVSKHFANQARATATVAWASLLDGKVEARLLQSDVFASGNPRVANASFRLDPGGSRIAEVYVLGTKVTFPQAYVELPIAGLGTLYLNQTVTDPAAGTIENYALRLKLNNGMDIVVGGVQARVGHDAAGPEVFCMTWSEAYPVGSTLKEDAVLGVFADVRHNQVMGDVMGAGTANGRLDDVPAESASTILAVDTALATHQATITNGSAGATTVGAVQGLNLLNGLITADLVRARANAGIVLGPGSAGLAADATGSVLVGLKVSSTVVQQTPAANTVIPVEVGGTTLAEVHLNEQTVAASTDTDAGVHLALQRTNMLRLVVLGDGLGLAIGTQIVVGHAIAIVTCGDTAMPPMPPMDFGDPLGLRA